MARAGQSTPRTRSRRLPVLLAALVAFALAGCTGSTGDSAGAATTKDSPSASTGAGGGAVFGRIPDIVDNVQPSVVTIRTRKALGSGVIYKSDGVIVTNRHVVARSERKDASLFENVTVVFATGKKARGHVVGADYRTDLAVIKIKKGGSLNTARFRTGLPEVGELAVAMGSPLGFNESVTAGIISGLNRSFPVSQTKRPLVNLIQTDAPISPGNSGGALVDENGRVVGITELYLPPGKTGAVAIGFAIPSTTVVDVVDQILKTGHVQHATLGIGVVALTPALAKQLGVDRSQGALVRQVVKGSGAAKAGIQPGDVIVVVGGKKVREVNTLYAVLRDHDPGDQITVTVVRGDQQKKLQVTLTG
ncbi:MAG: S1C family serine protease [Streptosporangiales bacterium]